MPEFVPEKWNGPHVCKRLADAFRTLAYMPGGGRGESSPWPPYAYEYIEEPKEGATTRVRPTATEISQMEHAIAWPGQYLGGEPAPQRIGKLIAIAHAFDREIELICKKRRWYLPTVLRQNRRGLQIVAWGLNRDRVQTW
jgi:hypothetical protein